MKMRASRFRPCLRRRLFEVINNFIYLIRIKIRNESKSWYFLSIRGDLLPEVKHSFSKYFEKLGVRKIEIVGHSRLRKKKNYLLEINCVTSTLITTIIQVFSFYWTKWKVVSCNSPLFFSCLSWHWKFQ